MRKNIVGIICAALLSVFTIYVLLDTFVIVRVYRSVETPGIAETSQSAETEAETRNSGSSAAVTGVASTTETAAEPSVSENSYSDGNISIVLTEYREYDTTIYVADVTLSSPEYLKTAFASSSYGRNVTAKTSVIAEECGAILAINGDYYGAQSQGYVIRNGVLYRDSTVSGQEDLVIYSDGSFGIISESDISAEKLLQNGAYQVLSFGPGLIVGGDIAVTQGEEVGRAKSSNPRTAIGIIDECHYLLVVSDGRTAASAGLSLYQLAEFMQGLGAETAYNLDGGGSSTMYFNGEVVNNPTSNGSSIKERKVSDIVYIG